MRAENIETLPPERHFSAVSKGSCCSQKTRCTSSMVMGQGHDFTAPLRPGYCSILARCVEILIAISSRQAGCRFGKSSDDGQLPILTVLHLVDHNNGKATGGPTPHIRLG